MGRWEAGGAVFHARGDDLTPTAEDRLARAIRVIGWTAAILLVGGIATLFWLVVNFAALLFGLLRTTVG